MSAASKDHMTAVAGLPCAICGCSPVEVHHLFASVDRSPFLTAPLCTEHHRGGTGFHGLGEREFNRRYKTSEKHLLAKTLELLA